LEETEIYADFSTRTKSIHNISVEETVTIPTQPSTEPSTNTNDGSETAENIEPFILYISGLDTRKPTLSKSRSDVNILVAVNPQTKQILLINTPRGFYIPNPAGNGALDKLTHCGNFGINCSVQALSDFYNITIDHYAQINFTGFKTLVDAIGGITVYSDMEFSGDYFSFF
jgi:anionic cell wall polymer biosynthesis LytR-Cps2A-Psr (LCP) family protein